MDYTWDLTVLYHDFDDPAIERDFARAQELAAKAQGLLQGDALGALEGMTDAMEDLQRITAALGSFASLTLAADATNERAQQLMDKLMQFSVKISLLSSKWCCVSALRPSRSRCSSISSIL